MAQGVKKRIPVLFGVESFSGGVLRHVVDLAVALDPEEFEVHLITSSLRTDQEASDSIKLLEQHGIRVVLLPIRHGAAFPGDQQCDGHVSVSDLFPGGNPTGVGTPSAELYYRRSRAPLPPEAVESTDRGGRRSVPPS